VLVCLAAYLASISYTNHVKYETVKLIESAYSSNKSHTITLLNCYITSREDLNDVGAILQTYKISHLSVKHLVQNVTTLMHQ